MLNLIKEGKEDDIGILSILDMINAMKGEETSAEITDLSIRTIRVDVNRLDVLMNLIGELVISKNGLAQIGRKYEIKELNEALTMIGEKINYLQDEIMRIRMIPVEHIFNRLPRFVRDLSKEMGKEINFIVEGKETELDKAILDEISDSLIHLIKNAVGHGIETSEVREDNGKDRIGKIRLVANRERDNVVIIVEDDGKGINPDEIRETARKNGLTTDELTDEEILDLIFIPGMTTVEEATETSGRGVGLDAVKTKIESLGGNVKLESKVGVGTKVALRLPPTLAIVKALLSKIGDEMYAISISDVIEIAYIEKDDIRTINGKEAMILRDRVLPLLRLSSLFHIYERDGNVVIVVDTDGGRIGLIVDAIVDQPEIIIKRWSGILHDIKSFCGVTILGDGRVVPVLDVSTLIYTADNRPTFAEQNRS
jgi:two-component system chemotaxis sensor kinase CheA